MYDLIVVGAGPAGSAAAYHAADGGLRVLVVDKTAHPREKPCGDALSPAAVAAVARMGVERLPGRTTTGLVIHHPHHAAFRSGGGAGWRGAVVPRATLDALLLDRARAAGADVRTGLVHALVRHGERVGGVRVVDDRGASETLHARFVVAATGSAGLARLLGRPHAAAPVAWGVAARTYLTTRGAFGDDLELHLPVSDGGRHLFGYGWVFPAGERTVNVGIGVVPPHGGVAIRRLAETFIAGRVASDPRLRHAVADRAVAVAPIAVGPRIVDVPGLLQVGDAAGLVNPFTGEGIAAALASGELAARTLAAGGDETAYAGALRAAFGDRHRLAPGLASAYDQAGLLLARGWSPRAFDSLVGEALLRMTFGGTPETPARPCRSEVDRMRDELVRDMTRHRPFLGELLRRVLADARAGFGTVTEGLVASRGGLSASDRRTAYTLEAANLVERLHHETAGDQPDAWGANTLRLALADCLSAMVFRGFHRLDPATIRTLSATIRRSFRRAAESRLAGGPARDAGRVAAL